MKLGHFRHFERSVAGFSIEYVEWFCHWTHSLRFRTTRCLLIFIQLAQLFAVFTVVFSFAVVADSFFVVCQ